MLFRSIFQAWWQYEAGTVDGGFFDNLCGQHGLQAERVRDHLLEEAGYGRWRWKPWIGGSGQVPEALGRQAHEVKAFVELFQNSKYEKEQFLAFTELTGKADSIRALVQRALLRTAESSSVFCIQLIHDWLALGDFFDKDSWNARINFPGLVSPENWSWVCPLSLEELLEQRFNRDILKINRKADRI